MEKKIHAAVMVKPGLIEVQDLLWPNIENGGMLLKVEMCGICGTDKHAFRGDIDYAFPLVPGHEIVGIVKEITKEASETLEFSGKLLNEGDRVVICPDILCNRCYYCKHSFGFTWCENMRSYGAHFSSRIHPFVAGGWAEYMYVFPGSIVYKIPEFMSLKMAVLLEPLAGSYSLDKLMDFTSYPSEGLVPGFSVVIQGLGPIGLIYIAKAKLLGAGNIIAIGKYQNQLYMAKKFGADYLININETSLKERINIIREITNGRGADICIDCAGVPEVMSEEIEMIRRGGFILEVGAAANKGNISLSPYEICAKSIRIIGMNNCSFTAFIPAIRMLEKYSNYLPFEDIITHDFSIDEACKAIQKSMESDSLKVVFSMTN